MPPPLQPPTLGHYVVDGAYRNGSFADYRKKHPE